MKKSLSMVVIIIGIVSCKTIVILPDPVEQNIDSITPGNSDEQAGKNLTVSFPENYTARSDKESRYYHLLVNKNDTLRGQRGVYESLVSDFLLMQRDENNGEYRFSYEDSRFRGTLLLDDRYKITGVELDSWTPWDYGMLYLESTKYYIPDYPLKPGDSWEQDFNHLSKFAKFEKKRRVHLETDMAAKYRLAGYTDFNNQRCAVIVSEVTLLRKIMFWDKRNARIRAGSAIIYDYSIKNTLYLDYRNQRIIHTRSEVTCRAKGNYMDHFGGEPGKAFTVMEQMYEGLVNGEETFVAVFIKDYEYIKK